MYIEFYSGNQLENLICKLADDIKTSTTSPFESPTVIVQSQGMKKWISLEVARRNGICANINFRFPKEFIYDCFHRIAGTLPEESLYEKEVMTWKLMELLPGFLKMEEFSALGAYLGTRDKEQVTGDKGQETGDEGQLKEFQLCEKIAALYDQYLIYRPVWIEEWQNGEEPEKGEEQDKWQGILWRALEKELGKGHPVQIKELFVKAFEKMPDIEKLLPKNIYMFGISSLPDFYVKVMKIIAAKTSVRLYHMNPSREFWGDIRRKYDSSLLASMGILGRDFTQVLLNNDITQNIEDDLYTEDFEGRDILTRLQKDIFELAEPADMLANPDNYPDRSYEKHDVKSDDRSVEIHSCHSTMREVEVLYDNLLEMFNTDEVLKPSDVIVMAPDIEEFAPYIDAVFGTAAEETADLKIPYSIADRSIRRESQIIDSFLKILDMHNSRLSSVDVMGLLEVPAILKRFDISDTELESIQHWVKDTQIRWGKDSKSRAELGLPEIEENTWEAGFKRLLLGYAMPGNNEDIYNGILPYDNIEGMDSVALGKFYEFVEVLSRTLKTLKTNFTLSVWTERLEEAADSFFKADYMQQPEINKLKDTFAELKKYESLSQYGKETGIPVITHFLKGRLEQEGSTHGFLKKGVTFCSMLPMRSIPFKIICLIGMNHDKFPRESKSTGFDLMRKYSQPGDRSKRLDDRYLFLESIISARKKLYISYTGQSIKDNTAIPPSVLVSELIDYIQSYFKFEIEDKINTDPDLLKLKKKERKKLIENKASDFLVTKHKLQAFNPEYFRGRNKRLYSYSKNNCMTARNFIKKRVEMNPIGLRDLSLPERPLEEVTIDDLINFFNNPSKHFLQKRLEIFLRKTEEALETSELFKIDALNQTIMGNEIIEQIIRKKTEEKDKFNLTEYIKKQYEIQKASGNLPHGNFGQLSFDELSGEAAGFAGIVMQHSRNTQPVKTDIDLKIDGIKLSGRIPSVFGDELLHFRFAETKAKDRIRLWINFLALNASSDAPIKAKMICKAKDGYDIQEVSLQEITDNNKEETLSSFCRKDLEKLLGYYRMGLLRPLKFFPETSWAYFQEKVLNGKDVQAAIKSAGEKWSGFNFPENRDINFALCFGEGDIFDQEFEDCATEIFDKNGKYLKESTDAE